MSVIRQQNSIVAQIEGKQKTLLRKSYEGHEENLCNCSSSNLTEHTLDGVEEPGDVTATNFENLLGVDIKVVVSKDVAPAKPGKFESLNPKF
jgi:hypothetical protein